MFDTLITASELDHLLQDCRVVDCRASLVDDDWGRAAFRAGHIPGAVFADLTTDLSAPLPAGELPPFEGGRHPLPDRDALADRFRAFGIHRHQQVVFYDDAGGAFAARGWWLARWLGHAEAAVLDGGISAWDGDLVADDERHAPGDFEPGDPLTLTVDSDALAADLAAAAATAPLIDARTERRFAGLEEPIDPVAGHIPGAVCRPFQENLDAAGRFLRPDALRVRFDGLTSRETPAICYCGSGVTAAHNILAIRLAGFGEATLYPASWSGWIADSARPRATGD